MLKANNVIPSPDVSQPKYCIRFLLLQFSLYCSSFQHLKSKGPFKFMFKQISWQVFRYDQNYTVNAVRLGSAVVWAMVTQFLVMIFQSQNFHSVLHLVTTMCSNCGTKALHHHHKNKPLDPILSKFKFTLPEPTALSFITILSFFLCLSVSICHAVSFQQIFPSKLHMYVLLLPSYISSPEQQYYTCINCNHDLLTFLPGQAFSIFPYHSIGIPLVYKSSLSFPTLFCVFLICLSRGNLFDMYIFDTLK